MELAELLLEQRIVLVTGPLDDATASRAAAELMTLDASGDEAVTMRLTCPTSELDAAMVLMDTVDLLGVEVHATCTGRLSGPAVGVLAVADRRTVHPHASIELREPVSSVGGRYDQIDAAARHVAGRVDSFVARLAEACGRDAAEVGADFRRGRFLDAPAAVAYGLADEVASSIDRRS